MQDFVHQQYYQLFHNILCCCVIPQALNPNSTVELKLGSLATMNCGIRSPNPSPPLNSVNILLLQQLLLLLLLLTLLLSLLLPLLLLLLLALILLTLLQPEQTTKLLLPPPLLLLLLLLLP